jgi:glutathione S-transferase
MSLRLLTTLRSPFARKVRTVLLEKGLPHEVVAMDLSGRGPDWYRDNPIGKIPVLDLHGTLVPDSTVICETLEDRYPVPPMYERDRLRCRILEELADSAGESAVVGYFSRSNDPAGAERAMVQISRLLAAVSARLSDWPPGFGIADAAWIGTLGYLELRHGRAWRTDHPELADWFDGHAARPSVAATVPAA